MHSRALVIVVFVFLSAAVASAATHQVLQSGNTFVPDDLTIEVGDTVEWIHSLGLHTVTEGLDDGNPPIGEKLFDEPLTSASPLVAHTFTEAGDVPYYCRPHLIFFMTGVIRVTAPTPVPELLVAESWSGLKNLYR